MCTFVVSIIFQAAKIQKLAHREKIGSLQSKVQLGKLEERRNKTGAVDRYVIKSFIKLITFF
jgi:hypothetical protein